MLEAKGLFYGIGHSPNSQLLDGQVELDSSGHVLGEKGIANELDQNAHIVIYYYINHSPLEEFFFCNLLHLCIIYKFKY